MTWDSTDGYVLLFGGEAYGSTPTQYYNDTWSFSDGKWTNHTNFADAPPVREGTMLADDPADHEVVLFGGYPAKGNNLEDTWTYAGGVWTNRTGSVGTPPPETFWGSMAYDNQTHSVILFGGVQGTHPLTDYTNETWSFSGNAWTELSPTRSPPARNSASLVDDVNDGYLMLFGGQNQTGYFNDTWAFSGTDWSRVTTPVAPYECWGAGLVYYAADSEVAAYGGTPQGNFDTFTYGAGTWTAYVASPNPGQTLAIVQMAYDYADHYAVLFQDTFGGVNSTWELSLVAGPPPPALSVAASATPQSGMAPLPVAFTSEVSGGTPPYTVTWSFGDSTPDVTGSPSVAGNTSHTYENVGSYGAVLTVVDAADAMVTKDWTITTTAPPLTLSLAASPTSAKVNQTVTFTSTPAGGVPPYTYAWTFGDAGTATTRNATHFYTTAGQYKAELIVQDHASSRVSQNATITVTTNGPTSTSSTGDWWVYLVVVVVVVIAILVAVWYRRRKPKGPAATPSPSPPPGQAGGGPDN